MRPLRWRSHYQTGNPETDRRNRQFLDCLNSLINATGKREHCREMEELIERFSVQVEHFLHTHAVDSDLGTEFGRQLITNLPLSAYGNISCRQCGLCNLAQERIAERLKLPVECLFKGS